MKKLIEFNLENYSRLFKHPVEVLEHLFCTNGNGINMDLKGYIPDNYGGKEPYSFREPVVLKHIYPYDKNRRFIPLLKYKGCRDVGFKDAVKYFVECIKITPDEVKGIVEWKNNLDLFQEVLDTPEIQDEYQITDFNLFLDKIKNLESKNNANSVTKQWFFDVTHSDCLNYIKEEVSEMWRNYDLGNDSYIVKAVFDEELFDRYPRIYFWLKYKGVQEKELVIIHYWW